METGSFLCSLFYVNKVYFFETLENRRLSDQPPVLLPALYMGKLAVWMG